jgi:cell division protease FtsH
MIAQWGMSDVIGPVNLGRGEEHPFLGRELSAPKRYSEEMAWMIDQEIQRTLLDAEKAAAELLETHRTSLNALAESLITEEILDREQIEMIILRAEPDMKPAASA